MRISVLSLVGASGLSVGMCGAASAEFIPVSATRTVESGFPAAPITSSAFGAFMQSQSGSVTAGSPGNTVYGTGAQTSNIDASLATQISINASASGGCSGGGLTNMTGTPLSQLLLTFQLTEGATLVHTLVPSNTNYAFAMLTPQGQSAINLFGPGVNNIALAAGTYTLTLQVSEVSLGFAMPTTFSQTIVGGISFVPGPGGAALMGMVVLMAGRRRRWAE